MSTKTTYKQTEVGLIPEDWEVKKIDDVLEIFPTASYSRAEQCEDGDVQYLHYGDIHTKYNFHLKINNNNLPKISVDKLKNYKTLEIGDLIMADASEDYVGVGKCVEILELSEKKAIAGLHTFLLRDKKQNFSLGFKGYMTTSNIVKKQFYRTAVGTKVYSLSKTNLQNLKIPLPPLPEQKKIADCLSTWDVAIEKQSALINALTDRKKALMQQLLTGKKRLPGFSDEWKEVRLGEICEIKKGSQINKIELSSNLGFPVINGGIEPSGYHDDWNVADNTITISEGGNSCGFINFIKEKFWSGGHCYTLQNLKININKIFLFYFLKNSENQIMKLRVGSGLPNIQQKDIKNFDILLPKIEEQTAIAEILATADRELQLQKEKLAQLQSQKKGLMQVLLTGKKRLLN